MSGPPTIETVISCRVCSVALVVGKNWNPSQAKIGSRICKACHRSYADAYWLRNPDRRIAASKRYYDSHREELLAERKANRARDRDYYRRNAQAHLEQDRVWREANPDKVREMGARYRRENPGKIAAKTARRAASKAAQTPENANHHAIGSIYALAATATRIVGASYHVDHIKPLSKGGLHHEDNLVVMRADLNLRKQTQEWPWLRWFTTGEPLNFTEDPKVIAFRRDVHIDCGGEEDE